MLSRKRTVTLVESCILAGGELELIYLGSTITPTSQKGSAYCAAPARRSAWRGQDCGLPEGPSDLRTGAGERRNTLI